MDAQQAGTKQVSLNHEREARAISGWPMLMLVIVFYLAAIALFVAGAVLNDRGRIETGGTLGLVIPAIVLLIVAIIASPGFFTLEPNETRVLVLFGAYRGTVRQGGFRWANPFFSNGPAMKPGSEATAAPAAPGAKKGSQRLARAGVVVEEARLTHLAYAPEIAQAMLRRQQAEAVIDARQKIVHGAVSMVDMALRELADKSVVSLDDERKAAMFSNLMVVLCGESEVHPVVNTGTLYS